MRMDRGKNINTIGILLFLMNIFTPIKSIYGYSASFTVMNASLDRIEKIFAEPELYDTGKVIILVKLRRDCICSH